MNMVIVIEIVVGIFVLAGAVMYAVRDTRQRRSFGVEQERRPEDVREMQPSGSEHDAEKHDAEKRDAEKRDAEKRAQPVDPSVGVDA